MLLWANDFRAVFWVSMIPGFMAVLLLLFGLKEPAHAAPHVRTNPIQRANLARLDAPYWRVVIIGGVFTLARFSEAFLILKALQVGVALALVPLVMVVMNIVYASSAFPFGKLSDRLSHQQLLIFSLLVLIGADAMLALSSSWLSMLVGVMLWGLHMGVSQGLLSKMVADTAPEDLRGTAYGFFNLVSGLALLIASSLAGLLWQYLGSFATFMASAVFSVFALLGLLFNRHRFC